MRACVFNYNKGTFTATESSNDFDATTADLVLGFGAKDLLEDKTVYEHVRNHFPSAQIALCSTAGEICCTKVQDGSLSLAALQFSGTEIRTESINIRNYGNSYDAGTALLSKFEKEGLTYVLVLSDGSLVNGSELVRGMNDAVQRKIIITGGLAGDSANFASTLVGLNAQPSEGVILGIGFYGSNIKIGHGSQGGWEQFGLEKTVTRASANIVYEIEHTNALDIYKRYLGAADAEKLPASALLFPLFVTLPGTDEQVVRTILSIDNATGNMTFAGDIPEGSKVRFMRANFDKITNAASIAANEALDDTRDPEFALLISCVGRKLILQSRVEEEVEAVADVFHHKTLIAGFYSYGELSPLVTGGACQLHNQTMTITTFSEHE